MSKLEELEHKVRNLPASELAKFREWFIGFDHHLWDKQLESDSKAGKLHGLVSEALADYEAGKAPGNLKHFASQKFWALYEALPRDVRALADKNFQLLKSDSRHPSLHFKKIDEIWSVRVGAHYRALGTDVAGGIYWFWIGTHAEYDKVVA